jgi:hypothetical protein
MPSLDHLLAQLDQSKTEFGRNEGARTEALISALSQRRFRDAESLARFHEALLFIRSHPQNETTLQMAEDLLSAFSQRVDHLKKSGGDLTPLDYIEYSGIAGTVISGTFSYDIVRFLVDRYPACVEADWTAPEKPERLGATLPRFLPLLYEDSLVEANIPYLKWIDAATEKHQRLGWLIKRFEQLDVSGREKAELYDSLGLRVRWELRDSRASRTRNIRPVKEVFYHREPLIRRSEVSLDQEFQSPELPLSKLSRREGKEAQDMLRDTTTVRYRELYGITHGDPSSIVRADVGRGVEIFLWGLPPDRRLPLRAYHAGFTLKNGVPVNYIEGITICERMEIGFNTFYTFRDGESAWVYAKVLRLLNQVTGVTCISIDPYQLGFNNEEAIDSGAFWFYRKLGFRPTQPKIARLMASEERKIASIPGYRTPARVLRRLSAGNVVYEAPGTPRGDWDRFSIRNLGLAVQRRMVQEFQGDSQKIRRASMNEVSRVLGIRPGVRETEERAFDDLALVLALITDLAGWNKQDKEKVIQLIRAKSGADESRYARLLQRHAKLRSALIRLGEPTADVA